MSKVIALFDASIYAESVCAHAAWIAKRSGASVEAVHVLGRRELSSTPANLSGALDINASAVLLEELAELDRTKARLAHERGRLILDQAKANLVAAGVSVVAPRLRTGDLVETLHELEADSDLIVIGKRGEGADFAKLHLGSNLERVVRATHRPVLVASRAFKPITRFMIAFDGGASTRRAVDYIAKGAAFPDLECRLLHAGKDTPQIRAELEQAAASLRANGKEVSFDIVEGEPDQVIAERVVSEKIDLLVMGAYGHSRLRSLFVGSTTTEMIRSCKVPILLFR